MSLILDALRGGSPRATPRPNSNAAQTDAVLQTLGYGRFSATSPFNRIKRLVGYLVVGVMFAVVIWGTVIWVTTQYLSHDAPMEVSIADGSAAQPARPVTRPLSPAAPAASSSAPGQVKPAAPPPAAAAVAPPQTTPAAPVPPPSLAGRSAAGGVPGRSVAPAPPPL
jgi:hypothetical protein